MIRIILLFTLLLTPILVFSQSSKIVYPTGDKAVIYFVRPPGPGSLLNFRFFEKDKFIGRFSGVNYLRYECNSGKTLFWVKSENLDFVEADLKPGGVYIIEASPRFGAIHVAVKFKLVDYNDEKQMKRIYKVLDMKAGVNFFETQLTESQKKMTKVINTSIRKIQAKRRNKKKVKFITPEMVYPFLE